MAKYLVVYSYQSDNQPLIRLKYNFITNIDSFDSATCEYSLCDALGLSYEYREQKNLAIENIIKLGD